MLALVCALAVYAGSVALLDGVGSALGRDMSMLDKHLAVIAFAGLAALSHGEALWVALCVLGFGVYRWYRNGRRMDAAIALSFTSIALVVASMLHAVDAAERRTGLHAQALAAAVNQGDRQRLREFDVLADMRPARRQRQHQHREAIADTRQIVFERVARGIVAVHNAGRIDQMVRDRTRLRFIAIAVGR